MDGINECDRSNFTCGSNHLFDGIDGSRCIRSVSNRNKFCSFREKVAIGGLIECAIFQINGDVMNDDSGVFGSLNPRGDIGIVVKLRNNNLVTRLPGLRDCPTESKRQRGHILSKYNFASVGGSEKIRLRQSDRPQLVRHFPG